MSGKKGKVMTFSCHGSHKKEDATSKLFNELVKYVKGLKESATPDICDKIVAEILNRTVVINLAPAGEYQYDDPNTPLIENLTNTRLYWTYIYDIDITKYNETQLKLKSKVEDHQNIYNIKKMIIEGIIEIVKKLLKTPLEVIFTTAESFKPQNVKIEDVYSLIEYRNPNINGTNTYYLKKYIENSKEYGSSMDLEYMVNNIEHTRFYIGVKKDTDEKTANVVLREFYTNMIKLLNDIDKIISLKKYSNNLTYFSPNIEEVGRSLVPILEKITTEIIKKNDLKKYIEHPHIIHSEISNGYMLMCGPDYKLSRTKDDISYLRFIGQKLMRFGEDYGLSLKEQIENHFRPWVSEIKIKDGVLSKQMPKVSPYIVLMHTCNQCMMKDEYESGNCECFFNIEPETELLRRYRRKGEGDWIKYSTSSSS